MTTSGEKQLSVGFAGLGNIGAPMARCLLEAGFEVTAYDTRPERAVRVAGARVATDPVELAGCAVVCLAVPDDAATEQVVVGSGLLERLAEGATVLLHSTLLPETVVRLARRAGDRVGVLDAPVSGGADRAAAGTLTIMVGGEPAVLERARPVLEVLAADVTHAGPSGAGAAVKLANQLAMFAALAGAKEAIAFAQRHGVDQQTTLEVLGTSTGDSWVTRNWGFFDRLVEQYDALGTPVSYRPWGKDLFDVVAAARAAELPVPLAGLLSQLFPGLVEPGRDRG